MTPSYIAFSLNRLLITREFTLAYPLYPHKLTAVDLTEHVGKGTTKEANAGCLPPLVKSIYTKYVSTFPILKDNTENVWVVNNFVEFGRQVMIATHFDMLVELYTNLGIH